MLRKQGRREYLIGIPFVLACLVGMFLVMSGGHMPPVAIFAPIWLPIAAIWLALLGLMLGVARFVLTDWAVGERTDLVEIAEVVATWNMAFEVAIGFVLFAAALF